MAEVKKQCSCVKSGFKRMKMRQKLMDFSKYCDLLQLCLAAKMFLAIIFFAPTKYIVLRWSKEGLAMAQACTIMDDQNAEGLHAFYNNPFLMQPDFDWEMQQPIAAGVRGCNRRVTVLRNICPQQSQPCNVSQFSTYRWKMSDSITAKYLATLMI